MLSTAEALPWQIIFTSGALFISLCALSLALYVERTLRKEYPTKTLLNRLRGETTGLSGDFADLQERFSRFQKREGMRNARDAKQEELSVLEQAKEIAARADAQEPDNAKLALYRKSRLQ